MPRIALIAPEERDRAEWADLLERFGHKVRAYATVEAWTADRPESAACLLLDRESVPAGCGLPRFLAQRLPADDALPVVVLAHGPATEEVVAAMRAGAVSVLDTPPSPTLLREAVDEALRRNRAGRAKRAERAILRERERRLTPREHDVFVRVVRGMLNKQIALELRISEPTVKVHRASVMAKLDVLSVAELVRMAALLGLEIGDGSATS
ncbi:MAG: response regulator transcription factor [Kiritimatiellia bacterium]